MRPPLFPILLALLFSPVLGARELTEYFVRGGLPNVAAKAAAGEEVRVAFLGGSITAAAGWRPLTLARLQREFPKAKFTEIFAAVPGTGSDYGAPRVQRDALRHRPDLLFVEFAVNDGTGSPRVEAQMEGIVRQTWAANPRTDICFVYTVSEGLLKDLLAGEYQSTARSMEKVAVHYGIPSFNFGVEIARRIAAGTLVMSAPASVPADAQGNDAQGRLIFTRDKTHPTEAGHRVYAERLALALPEFFRARGAVVHALSAPLSPNHWQRARIVSVAETDHDGQWSAVPAGDVHLTTQGGENLVPPTWVAMEPGAKIEFRFKGTVLGLVGLKGPENGQFRVTVDDLPPETGTLFDSFSTPGRFFLARWFYSRPLAEAEHRVRLELLPTKIDKAAIMAKAGKPITDPKPYAAHGLYLSGFLIVGDPVGTKPPPPERTTPFTALDLPVSPTPPPGYVLAWADEFDGAALDTTRWLYRTGERYWSTQLPANVSVHDGLLWLACKKEKAGKSDYTAGGVISKKVFRYGYYEARFKVPPTKGWHTSFWMMHHEQADPTAKVGSRQEIDVCENDSVRLTRFGANLHEWSPSHFGRGHRNVTTPDESADFHVWGCEFTPEKITYYFDGRIVLVNDAKLIPDHGDMSIWLTVIASPLGATDAVEESRLPVYAVFDYVRFYAKK
ncbi:MAG: family 16 glycosylhydrolase [Verrucomicrobia bacterium]|nr:family 16 glycosylhydrolase [Verrucomicrobiota bacterium]